MYIGYHLPILTNLDGARVAVPEGGASKNCDSTRPREYSQAAGTVPATPEESMAASRSRKRPGPEQDADLERVVKKRVDLGADTDEDVIVVSQPATRAHKRANNQPTSATTIEHHTVSHMRATFLFLSTTDLCCPSKTILIALCIRKSLFGILPMRLASR